MSILSTERICNNFENEEIKSTPCTKVDEIVARETTFYIVFEKFDFPIFIVYKHRGQLLRGEVA